AHPHRIAALSLPSGHARKVAPIPCCRPGLARDPARADTPPPATTRGAPSQPPNTQPPSTTSAGRGGATPPPAPTTHTHTAQRDITIARIGNIPVTGRRFRQKAQPHVSGTAHPGHLGQREKIVKAISLREVRLAVDQRSQQSR